MKKLFKKSLACLIAVLMVMTSIPMTAMAADDETVNINLTGSYVGITAAKDNRYGASGQTAQLNVVNDRQDDNFTIGYVNIDISAYNGREFKNLPLTFGKRENALDDCQGLKFWYTGNTNADNYKTNGRIANDGNVTGTENGHLAKAVSYYALTEIASFTKAEFNAGTMTIDVAAAANATLARGGSRLVIMVTQAQSGGKADAGGWSDTWVTFNKAQTCAATLKGSDSVTGKLTNNGTGLVVAGSESRWASSQFNIVNDQEANNTSAGILRFDISALRGMSVESAKINYTIESWGDDSTGLVFYYSTSISNTSYINNGETRSTGWSCGAGTTANNSFATALGFSTSNTLANPQKNGTIAHLPYNSNINDALQKVLDSGATTLYVFIMQQTAGGKSGSPWSDTKIAPANVTIEYTVVAKEHTRADVASIKANITAKNLNNYPYTATSTSGASDDSYSKSSLTGDDEMLSVLYTYGVSGSSTYKAWGDDNYFNPGFQYGDATLLWDGENTMAVPINVFGTRTTAWLGSNGASDLQSVYIRGNGYADNSAVYLNHKWHTGTTPTTVGYKSGTNYTVDYVDGNGTYNAHGTDKDVTDYYSNTLYVDGSKLDFGSNKRITLALYSKIYYRGSGTRNYSRDSSSINGASIRVINYAPIANAIREAKTIYATVSANENEYCPNDLYKFYEALDKLTSFNPNNYFSKTTNNYAECCTAMEALDKYVSVAKKAPAKSEFSSATPNYTDGEAKDAQTHTAICANCGEEVEVACSFTLTNTNDSTCSATGTNTYTCSVCNGTTTETIGMKAHTWGNWVDGGATSGHTRKCQNCETWDTYVAHNSNTKIDGISETCTSTGLTDGYKCSDCGREMVAQETIQKAAHSFSNYVSNNNATCTQNATGTATCDNCTETDTKELDNTKLGHDFGDWTANADTETHTKVCANDTSHTETEDCTEGADHKCAKCGRIYVDKSAYEAAVAESVVIKGKTDEYTAKSLEEYSGLVDAVTAKIYTSQDEYDAATASIESAKDVLRKATITITLHKQSYEGSVDTETLTRNYGEKVELQSGFDNVAKWTITTVDEDGKQADTMLERATSTIELLAAKTCTVTVYEAEDARESEKEYTTVKLYGKNGVLVGIKYFEKGTELALEDAPEVAFYTFTGWTLEAKDGDVLSYYAHYEFTADEEKDRCNVHYNDTVKSYGYDQFVYLGAYAEGKTLALSTTNDESGLLTYIDGDCFYAPHAKDIYVIEVGSKVNSIAVTGSYSLADVSLGTGAVFNCKFYAVDMSKVQEFGVVVINPSTGAEKIVKADSASENNEYSVRVNLPSTTSLTSLKAKAYVVIDGVTLYSDVATQTL